MSSAPSVNPEGLPPAFTVEEAQKYFGDEVDFYQDAGRVESDPSTIIKIKAGSVVVVREGAVRI